MDNPSVPKRRIIDISTPGSKPPAPSSRPVIVGHKPSVADPMVSAHEHTPQVPPGDLAKNTTYPNRHNNIIDPHPATDKPLEPAKPHSTSVPIQTDTPEPTPPPAPEKPAPKPAEPAPQPQSQAQPPSTPIPPETAAPKSPDEPTSNQSPEQIKQMVSDKTYFAPIASTKSWTWIMIAAIFLALIGIAGAIYLVMA